MTRALLILLAACTDAPRAPVHAVPVEAPPVTPGQELALLARDVVDLDRDGALDRVGAGYATTAGRRRAAVIVERRTAEGWRAIASGGWLGGGGGDASAIRGIEVADLDGDGEHEIVAFGTVGSKAKHASARLVVLALRDGALHERARVEWNAAAYTHGNAVAVRGTQIVTTGVVFDGTTERRFERSWRFADAALTAL